MTAAVKVAPERYGPLLKKLSKAQGALDEATIRSGVSGGAMELLITLSGDSFVPFPELNASSASNATGADAERAAPRL